MNSKIRIFFVVLLVYGMTGCTSFRTTSLYRLSNDSLTTQRTNKKLKGLPVKLKVPSHVSVVVYEQQVILAESENGSQKYNLVSFSPPQFQIETQLEYTDKIFLVDFKRPAAGILNLESAKMDDEQYFSQVQAEIEEKTIESISGVLETVKDPLASLRPKKPNTAKPTSSNTPEGESKEDVHFQKSVVAIQRFDISEPGWEEEMMTFVNAKLVDPSGVTLQLNSTQME